MRAGIALGSNLGDRLHNLRYALGRLLQLSAIDEPILTSHIYETEPVDTIADAGAFLNAVVEIGWSGELLQLLHELQTLEKALGRPSMRERNASRTIDLDILYAGALCIDKGDLTIPHPRLHLRRFVLQPLCDIRPELILPGQVETVAALLQSLADDSHVEPISAILAPAPSPASQIS